MNELDQLAVGIRLNVVKSWINCTAAIKPDWFHAIRHLNMARIGEQNEIEKKGKYPEN